MWDTDYVLCALSCATTSPHLSSNLFGLDVVAVEVALEVEVGEGFTFTDGEELLERGIRLDVVLVLEALFLDVVIHGLGDFRAAHEGAVGLAEELAEFIRDLGGALEDGRSARLGIRTFFLGTTLALASVADFTVDTLFELLDLREHSGDRFTERGEVASDSLDVFIKSRGGASRGGGCSGFDRGRGDDNRGGDCRGSGSGCGLLADRLLCRGGFGNRGRGGDFNGGGSFLLGDLLGGGLGGGAHYTGGGGRRRGHFTRYAAYIQAAGPQFWIVQGAGGPKFCPKPGVGSFFH